MSDEARKYLLDISVAIKPVERELEITGEAMSRLQKLPDPVPISHTQ